MAGQASKVSSDQFGKTMNTKLVINLVNTGAEEGKFNFIIEMIANRNWIPIKEILWKCPRQAEGQAKKQTPVWLIYEGRGRQEGWGEGREGWALQWDMKTELKLDD